MKMDSSNTRERIIVPLDRRTGHLKFTYPGQYWRRGRLLWPPGWGRRGCRGRRHFALLHRLVYPGGRGRRLLLPPIVNFFNFYDTGAFLSLAYPGTLVYPGRHPRLPRHPRPHWHLRGRRRIAGLEVRLYAPATHKDTQLNFSSRWLDGTT